MTICCTPKLTSGGQTQSDMALCGGPVGISASLDGFGDSEYMASFTEGDPGHRGSHEATDTTPWWSH